MKRNSILDQMGIVQWRLREPLDNANQADVTSAIKQGLSESSPEQGLKLAAEQPSIIEPNVNIDQTLEQNSEKQSLEKNPKKTQEYDWPTLIELLNDKKHCHSCSKVTPIIGDGDITTDWMFVFDSPTARDIEQQELLTGRVGQLFDAILVALQLDRQSIYLSSIFKCPPAANITEDAPLCDSLLGHQITLVQPKVVIAFGEFTAQALIKANEGLEQLRTQTHNCYNQAIKVVPTYSLMQMLDTPSLKAQVWDDLKAARLLVES